MARKPLVSLISVSDSDELTTALAFSPDDSFIAVGLGDGTVVLRDVTGLRDIKNLRDLDMDLSRGAQSSVSSSGKLLAILSDGSAYWDTKVEQMVFLRDQPHMLVTLTRRRVVIWDTAKAIKYYTQNPGSLTSFAGREPRSLVPPHRVKELVYTKKDYALHCMALTPDGSRLLVSSSMDGITSLSTNDWTATFVSQVSQCCCGDGTRQCMEWKTAFVNGGNTLVAASQNDDVCVYKLASDDINSTIQTLGGHTGSIQGVTPSTKPDSPQFVTTSCDDTAKVWDIVTDPSTGRRKYGIVRSFEGHPVAVSKYMPDGERIVTGSHNGEVNIWSAVTGRLMRNMHKLYDLHHASPFTVQAISEVAVSNSGRLVAVVCDFNDVHILLAV